MINKTHIYGENTLEIPIFMSYNHACKLKITSRTKPMLQHGRMKGGLSLSKSIYQRLRRIENRLDSLEQWRKHCEGMFKPTKNGEEVAKAVQEAIEFAFRSSICDTPEDKQDSFHE